MPKLIRDTLEFEGQKTELLIEIEEPSTRGEASGVYGPTRGDEPVTQAFEKAMTVIRTCAQQVVKTTQGIAQAARPTEVEVQFGVKIEGTTGIAFLAKTGMEAQLQVTLTWKDQEQE